MPSESAAGGGDGGGGDAEEARHGKAEREGFRVRVLGKGMRDTGAMADDFSVLTSIPPLSGEIILKQNEIKEDTVSTIGPILTYVDLNWENRSSLFGPILLLLF